MTTGLGYGSSVLLLLVFNPGSSREDSGPGRAKEMQPGRERTHAARLMVDLLGKTSEKSPFLRPPKPKMPPAIGCWVRKSLLLTAGLNIPCSFHLPSSRDAQTSHDIPDLPAAATGPSALKGKVSPSPAPSELQGGGLSSEVLSTGCRVLQPPMAGRQWRGGAGAGPLFT